MNSYTLGTLIRLTATFAVGGVNTDPTVVTFKVKVPSGTITTYVYGTDAQLVKSATGVYYVDYTTVAEGIHAWRMQGTGAAIGAEEQQFTVKDSRFS
jgi:hypothetical protein